MFNHLSKLVGLGGKDSEAKDESPEIPTSIEASAEQEVPQETAEAITDLAEENITEAVESEEPAPITENEESSSATEVDAKTGDKPTTIIGNALDLGLGLSQSAVKTTGTITETVVGAGYQAGKNTAQLTSNIAENGMNLGRGALQTTSEVAGAGLNMGRDTLRITGKITSSGITFASNTAAAAFNTTQKNLQNSLETLGDVGEDLTTLSSDFVGQQFQNVLQSTIATAAYTGKTIDTTLIHLSGAPEEEATSLSTQGIRLALGLLPIVGEFQSYGEARSLYREGLIEKDPEKAEEIKKEALRKCLVACTLVALQTAALPASGVAQVGLNAAGTVIGVADAAKTTQEVTKERWYLPNIGVDMLTPRADIGLQYKIVHDAMVSLLLLEFDSEKSNEIAPGITIDNIAIPTTEPLIMEFGTVATEELTEQVDTEDPDAKAAIEELDRAIEEELNE